MVTPIGKAEPLGIPVVSEVLTPLQLSPAVAALKFTVAVHRPASLVFDTLGGQLMVGASLSTTVMVKEQAAVKPTPSVAV